MLRSDGDDGDGDRGRAAPRGEARERSLESGRALADAVDARRGDGDDAPLGARWDETRDGTHAAVGPRHGEGQEANLAAGVEVEDGDPRGTGHVPADADHVRVDAAVRDRHGAGGVRDARGEESERVHGTPVAVAPAQLANHPRGAQLRGAGRRGGDILAGGEIADAPRRDRAVLEADDAVVARTAQRDAHGTRAKPDGRAKLAERGETPRRRHGAPPSDDETVFANGCSS